MSFLQISNELKIIDKLQKIITWSDSDDEKQTLLAEIDTKLAAINAALKKGQ